MYKTGLIHKTGGISYNKTGMARIKGDKLTPILEKKALQELFFRAKKIGSVAEISVFLDLFFTNEERRLILNRAVILELLREGKSYSNIVKCLKVSKNTISNVRDITEKRGYGRNSKRRRIYSSMKIRKKKEGKLFLRYRSMRSVL
ncbi:hypothetical protein D4R51_02500 [bacterium]|nr:MAG: hypothetical protein D4R51_02500 [bacterium]